MNMHIYLPMVVAASSTFRKHVKGLLQAPHARISGRRRIVNPSIINSCGVCPTQ